MCYKVLYHIALHDPTTNTNGNSIKVSNYGPDQFENAQDFYDFLLLCEWCLYVTLIHKTKGILQQHERAA